MSKTFVVALREYRAAVRSKAFVIGLIAMPVIMGGAILVQLLLKDRVDTADRRVAVVDRSGTLAQPLTEAAAAYNEFGVYEGEGAEKKQVRPKFVLEVVEGAQLGQPPESTLALSQRVRNQELFAFLEIGESVIRGGADASDPTAGDAATAAGHAERITYHSETPVDDAFRRWATEVLTKEIQRQRSQREGLDAEVLARVTRPVELENLGLVDQDVATGEISEPEQANIVAHMFVPMGLMMLVFLAVMVGATPLVQAVMEEKQARISEVLLGCIRPFPLMCGKLLGTVAVAITTVAVYLAGAYVALKATGYGHLFPPTGVIVWLFVFQSLAVLMFGALFIAVGAAVSDMREAQSMMMPVMVLAMCPMFVWFHVVKEPTSALSVGMSLFPPATPMLMLLRMAVPPGVPPWQSILAMALVLLTTAACVYVAGRIFRVGVLMQGKGASLRQMAGWVLRG